MYEFKYATSEDENTLRNIFRHSILNLSNQYYTPQQLMQWAAVSNNEAYWTQLLETQTCILGIHQTTIIGYVSLSKNGFVDHLYVSPLFQRKGLGTALLQQIEIIATNAGIRQLETDANLISSSVFRKAGYQLVKNYLKNYNGEVYPNSILIKKLLG